MAKARKSLASALDLPHPDTTTATAAAEADPGAEAAATVYGDRDAAATSSTSGCDSQAQHQQEQQQQLKPAGDTCVPVQTDPALWKELGAISLAAKAAAIGSSGAAAGGSSGSNGTAAAAGCACVKGLVAPAAAAAGSNGGELPWQVLFHQVMGDSQLVPLDQEVPLTGVGEHLDRRLSSVFIEPFEMQVSHHRYRTYCVLHWQAHVWVTSGWLGYVNMA